MASRTYENGSPSFYANEKLGMLQRRATALKPMLERFVPIAFPGADRDSLVFACMGFTAFSTGWGENTTDGDPTVAFHEVGLFQCPAGPRTGPAPNPDARAPDNAYGRIALAPEGNVYGDMVRRMLNRRPSMEHNAWKPSSETGTSERDVRAREDQTAVGLANLRGDEASVRALLNGAQPNLAGDANGWSTWRVFTMFTAMSRGPGGAFTRIRGPKVGDRYPYLAALAATPENVRLQKYIELVDADIRASAPGIGAAKGRSGSAYGIVRSMQKLYSGRRLAEQMGGPVGVFDPSRMSPAVEDRITRTAYGVSIASVAADVTETVANVGTIAVNAVSGESLAPKVGAIVVLAAVTAGVIYAVRS